LEEAHRARRVTTGACAERVSGIRSLRHLDAGSVPSSDSLAATGRGRRAAPPGQLGRRAQGRHHARIELGQALLSALVLLELLVEEALESISVPPFVEHRRATSLLGGGVAPIAERQGANQALVEERGGRLQSAEAGVHRLRRDAQ